VGSTNPSQHGCAFQLTTSPPNAGSSQVDLSAHDETDRRNFTLAFMRHSPTHPHTSATPQRRNVRGWPSSQCTAVRSTHSLTLCSESDLANTPRDPTILFARLVHNPPRVIFFRSGQRKWKWSTPRESASFDLHTLRQRNGEREWRGRGGEGGLIMNRKYAFPTPGRATGSVSSAGTGLAPASIRSK
jgi:hypothetical protein